jgi:hypothetical protein
MMAVPAAANAAACRDSKGHFIKCAGAPAAVAAPAATHAAVAAHPVPHATAAAHVTTAPTGRKAPCRDAKGRFKKC